MTTPLDNWVAEDEKGLAATFTLPPGLFADSMAALDKIGERPSAEAMRDGIKMLQRTIRGFEEKHVESEAKTVKAVDGLLSEMQAMRVIMPKTQEDMRRLNSLPPELNKKIRDYWETSNSYNNGAVIIASMATSFALAPIKAEVMDYMENHYDPTASDFRDAYAHAQANEQSKLESRMAKCYAGIALRMQKEVRELAGILGIDLRTNKRNATE